MLRVVHFWGQERGLTVGRSALPVTKKESSQEGKKSIRLSMKCGHDFAIDLAILLAHSVKPVLRKLGTKLGRDKVNESLTSYTGVFGFSFS